MVDDLWSLKQVIRTVHREITTQAIHKWIKAGVFEPARRGSSTGPGKGHMLSFSDIVWIGVLRSLFALGLGVRGYDVPGPIVIVEGMTDDEIAEFENAGLRKNQRYLELCNYQVIVYYETITLVSDPFFAPYLVEVEKGVWEAPCFFAFRKGSKLWPAQIQDRNWPVYSVIDVSQWSTYVLHRLERACLVRS